MIFKKFNKKVFLKKFLAVCISLAVFNSFVITDSLYSFTQPSTNALIPVNTYQQTFINPINAKITDTFSADSEKSPKIVFIQDLHGNVSVQKNIAEILKTLDKQYGIDTILLEGLPAGKADTTVLNNLKKYEISDVLLKRDILTGPEYYIINNKTNAQIYGLENWKSYIQNIKRAAQIIQDNAYITDTYNDFKNTVYEKIPGSKKLQKYINFDLSNKNFLEDINKPLIKYKDLHKYIFLSDNINKINTKKINEEYASFTKTLQQDLDFGQYNNLIELSKKENLTYYYNELYKLVSKDKYINKYKDLYDFLKYSTQKANLNIVSLISQQNKYFNDYLTSSDTKKQEQIFILKMTQLFESFLQLSISDEEYNFFTDNYERYVNLLSKYLAQDYYDYEDLLFYDIIFDYHKTNKDRNETFVKNILKVLKNKNDKNKITVAVAGGFHSSILEKLKSNNISYILLTPSIDTTSNTKFYNEILISTLAEKNALAPLKAMLVGEKILPQGTEEKFLTELIKALGSVNEDSPEKTREKILSFLREEFALRDDIPVSAISVEINQQTDSFIIKVNKQKLEFKIQNNKIVWESDPQNVTSLKKEKHNLDLGARFIAFVKKKFNVFEATSLKLNPFSPYASNFMTKRLGQRKNFMFSLSMFLSSLKMYKWSYDLMMGFASLKQTHAKPYTINFEEDFSIDIKEMKAFEGFKDRKLEIKVEQGIDLTKEDIIRILKKAIKRMDEPVKAFKETLFIGIVDKSTNLFEDHLNNGFIGINEGLFHIEDQTVQRAMLEAGLIHEISHELKGPLDNNSYKVFEEKMMFSDMKYVIDYVVRQEFGSSVDLSQILYTEKYDYVIKKITDALLSNVYDPRTKKSVPLFTSNVRFIRKFRNYKYNIDDIAAFIKRKDFTINERKGQLSHIENEYLIGNPNAQKHLFSQLIKDDTGDLTMQEFLERHISAQRRAEVTEKLNDLFSNLENMLNSSDLKDKKPELVETIVKNFKKDTYECLELMYKRMPSYLFGRYYNEQGVIADHQLNHSIELLNSAIKILAREISTIETIDLKTVVYGAFMHDLSCCLLRLDHEQNSATWARTILQGYMSDEQADKIYYTCLGHKKAKNGVPRTEHERFYEAKLVHDADGLAAALDLKRILGVWLKLKEPIYIKGIPLEKRINLINQNKYLYRDGGDAINDLMRQFLRRNPNLYLTQGAKEIILASKSNPYTIKEFLQSQEAKDALKEYGITFSNEEWNQITNTVDETLANFIEDYQSQPDVISEDNQESSKKVSEFGIKAKFSLFIKILKYMFGGSKTTDFKQNIAISDIHGGYARLAELIINLLDPTYDITGKTDTEIDNTIIDRLQLTGNNNIFYILGDLLDRGSRQVESFELVKRIADTGKMKYVIGNHDLYAFMNLLGLHLPSYPNYKGIKDDYIDFKGRKVKDLLEEKRKTSKSASDKSAWAAKLFDYMKYSDKEQKEWSKKEEALQKLFADTFGFELDKKGKDVLNDTDKFLQQANSPDMIKEMFKNKTFITFHKKFFGRNVGIAVYTGIRAVNKMSINWWIDRQQELIQLKQTYPQYDDYWTQMETIVSEIINSQKEKFEQEEEKGNWQWGIIDAIMYRNYESTEWNALDWAYHKNWGGGENGFIAQRSRQLEQQQLSPINQVSYFDDAMVKELLHFYQDNFYLYRIDQYGICYTHSLLPVDDEGDVSLGYVDKDGVFRETDENGKRIKGFFYKGKQYKGKKVFKGLKRIAEDIRNYDTSSNNLSEIMEALTLLTAIYADNTTRIKPANLKEMKKKFGFNKILAKKGITTMVVGHNPITKLDNQFEYVTLRFFNKEFKIINLIHIDGNMSPEYAPPKGAGIARLIGGGINTRGFISGSATDITSSTVADVSKGVFIATSLINLFPAARKVLAVTERISDRFGLIKQTLNSKVIKQNNTTLINIITNDTDLNKIETAHSKGIQTVSIVSKDIIKDIPSQKQLIEKTTLIVNGQEIPVEIDLYDIKVANGYMKALSIDYKEVENVDAVEIEKAATDYIIQQIRDNKYSSVLKVAKNVLISESLEETLQPAKKPLGRKFAKALEDSFGIIPVLYDINTLKTSDLVSELTQEIDIDKIKNILSAA